MPIETYEPLFPDPTAAPGVTAGVGDTPSPKARGYPGSKAASGLAERIIRQMPPHTVYIEAFAGYAAVYQRKRRAQLSILCDISEKTCSRLRSTIAVSDPAARVICGDALQLIATEPAVQDPQTLLYCDPPYLRETRTRLLYECEYATREEHTTLLVALLQVKCLAMVSGYDSPLYRAMLAAWRRVEIPAMTRGGMRTEVLWCNFPEPELLHDERFMGRDYRERERVKRKQKRWKRKFQKMKPTERQAVAAALAEVDPASLTMALRSSPPPPAGPAGPADTGGTGL